MHRHPIEEASTTFSVASTLPVYIMYIDMSVKVHMDSHYTLKYMVVRHVQHNSTEYRPNIGLLNELMEP